MSLLKPAPDPAQRHLATGGPFAADRAFLAALVESSPDAILSLDLDGVVTRWNAAAESTFGWSASEMIGSPFMRLVPADRRSESLALLDRLRQGRGAEHLETQQQTRDGRLIDVGVTLAPILDASGHVLGVSTFVRDISARKRTENEVSRMTRLYAALSHVNQAIVWSTSRDDLLARVCRVLVEHGGLQMAWIGWHDAQTQRLVPVAEFGDGQAYLQSVEVYGDDRPQGRGPTGRAFRTGEPFVWNDLLREPATLPWRAELVRRNFRASASFPIRLAGVVCGTLSVYADRPDFFHDQEVALLAEAACDLSFALDNFARAQAAQRAEHAARDEARFSDTMLDSMPGVVYFYDMDGRFLRWNRNFETVSGYGAADIATMNPLEFFTPEDRPRVAERIAEVFAEGESSLEADFVARDGRATPYFFTGRRTVFQQKSCLIGVGIDVSMRRRAESALREAEARFHTLFEQTPVGVVVVDPETAMVIECNEQAARQLGYTPEEFARLGIADFAVNESKADTDQRIAELRTVGQCQFDTRHRTRTGEVRDVFVTARLVELGGRPVIHCVFADVTERQRAEARLRESQARLLDAQRLAGLGNWELDLRTHALTGSAQTLQIFGVAPEESPLNGRLFLDFVHPEDRQRVQDARQAAMAGTGRLDIQHRIVLRDGTEKVVHQLADLKRDGEGRAALLAGTVHDITARVRLEAEREARHRAEAADLVKSAFLATMSHELRTPLNSIIGFTGIILKGLAGPLNDEQGKQLGMVRASARHLLALVNDVLDISKIEAGQLDIARHPFDLRQSVDKVIALVAPQVQARQLALHVQLAPDLGQAVSDQRRFEQVLLNLLSNAVKFTDHGEITLAAERTAESSALCVRVTDTGIGIRPEDLAVLFQPFRQIDSGLSRSHEGTGLGLAICQRLAALMGGEITASSQWGLGSTFTLVLPVLGPQPRQESP